MLVLFTACAVVACKKKEEAPPPPPPEVGVVRAQAERVPLTRDLVGRLAPTRSADVRARVAGVLQKRVYVEGSDVKQGQVLFLIDPAPLKAALDAANALLAQARANATNAHVAATRLRELAPKGFVSKADVDNAEASERSTAALVQQGEANVNTARINLGYATVTSPIDGRAGQQQVTEGALVGQGEATLLTTVDQIDPIYANFSQAVDEIVQLRRAQTAGSVTLNSPNAADVHLLLPDGSEYGEAGTLDFADTTVDPNTGALAARATIPNRDRALLPGMYVNVRVTLGTLNRAFLIAQMAVQRDAKGAYVLVVGADNKVVQKRITTDAVRGTNWIVTEGIDDGDQVVVSGVQRARPDSVVKPLPYEQLKQKEEQQRKQQADQAKAAAANAGKKGDKKGDATKSSDAKPSTDAKSSSDKSATGGASKGEGGSDVSASKSNDASGANKPADGGKSAN